MNFIIITEDGNSYQTANISKDDIDASRDGYLTILDIKDMTQHFGVEWKRIPTWEHS